MRAVVDTGQHDDGLGGIEAEGQRQQDADAGERADARQHADQRADDAADEGVQQDAGLQRDGETEHQAVDGGLHGG